MLPTPPLQSSDPLLSGDADHCHGSNLSTTPYSRVPTSPHPTLHIMQFLTEDGAGKLQETFDAASMFRVRPGQPAITALTNLRQLKVRGPRVQGG